MESEKKEALMGSPSLHVYEGDRGWGGESWEDQRQFSVKCEKMEEQGLKSVRNRP